MAKRQRIWARKQTTRLRSLLGNKCKHCGTTTSLTFDLIIPTDTFTGTKSTHHRKMEWSHRLSFYRHQYDIGNLQLLCDSCNSKKGHNMQLAHVMEDQPY